MGPGSMAGFGPGDPGRGARAWPRSFVLGRPGGFFRLGRGLGREEKNGEKKSAAFGRGSWPSIVVSSGALPGILKKKGIFFRPRAGPEAFF